MKINFRKPMLAAVITLTTASVYYAQQTQDTTTKSKSKDIEEVILKGVTDIAKDRKTPVAVSTVKAAQIVEKDWATRNLKSENNTICLCN